MYDYYFLLEFIVNTIAIGIFFYVGIRIALRYREFKRREFIFVGIAVIMMSELFWIFPINSFLVFISDSVLPYVIQAFITNIGLPIGIFFWLWAITDLMYKEKQKIILIISGVYFLSYEVLLILSLILVHIDGQLNPLLYAILIIFVLSFLLIVVITGIRFGYENVIAESPINRLQGKLMIIAFILFSIGCILVLMVHHFLIYTLILTPCFILFYFSFVLPKRIKMRLLRREDKEVYID